MRRLWQAASGSFLAQTVTCNGAPPRCRFARVVVVRGTCHGRRPRVSYMGFYCWRHLRRVGWCQLAHRLSRFNWRPVRAPLQLGGGAQRGLKRQGQLNRYPWPTSRDIYSRCARYKIRSDQRARFVYKYLISLVSAEGLEPSTP